MWDLCLENRGDEWPKEMIQRCNLELDRFTPLISHFRNNYDPQSSLLYTDGVEECVVDVRKAVCSERSCRTLPPNDVTVSDRSLQIGPVVLQTAAIEQWSTPLPSKYW